MGAGGDACASDVDAGRAAAVRRAIWRRSCPGSRVLSTDPRLLQKLIRIAGVDRAGADRAGRRRCRSEPTPTPDEIAPSPPSSTACPPSPRGRGMMWSVSLNRRASASVWRSRLTVKADAAAGCSMRGPRGFAGPCSIRGSTRLTGVRAPRAAGQSRSREAGDGETIESRVAQDLRLPAHQRRCWIRTRRLPPTVPPPPRCPPKTLARTARAAAQQPAPRPGHRLGSARAVPQGAAHPRSTTGRPARGHGTHVAGILAANWPEAAESTPLGEPLIGVCPDIELYDLRVLPDDPNDAPTSSPSSPRCSSSAT